MKLTGALISEGQAARSSHIMMPTGYSCSLLPDIMTYASPGMRGVQFEAYDDEGRLERTIKQSIVWFTPRGATRRCAEGTHEFQPTGMNSEQLPSTKAPLETLMKPVLPASASSNETSNAAACNNTAPPRIRSVLMLPAGSRHYNDGALRWCALCLLQSLTRKLMNLGQGRG